MITVFVQFRLPAPMSVDQARDAFLGSAPRYRALDGLVRKYYVLADDGRSAGGVYLWRDRAAAERFYDDDWRRFVTDKYGAPPEIAYFESPVIVDNVSGEITASDRL
jgi:hypothetical protein